MAKSPTYYLDETNEGISSDILFRNEFLQFKKLDDNYLKTEYADLQDKMDIIPRFVIDNIAPKSNYLEFLSYQTFVQNFLNPNTPYTRLLLKWLTGFGKTIGSISIAMEFINYYKRNKYYENNADEDIGSVYIIGFSKSIFINELLKYPEFGFVSREELDQIKKLQESAKNGSTTSSEQLTKFKAMLKRRLHNRQNNGFFKFIGYKELANMLFIFTNVSEIKRDITNMSDEEIAENIKNKTLIINEMKLKEFAHSLIICDEIHNVYNTLEKNNWGIALQTVLNYHDSIRAVFLSATPLNNSPTEIIDLLNLLLPRKYYKSLKKQDFFIKKDNEFDLILEKKEELALYLKGRISYISSKDSDVIASKQFIGESIPGIDYLKFIRCPMSDIHLRTYKQVFGDRLTIDNDATYLTDFVLPDPTLPKPFDKNAIGLYSGESVKTKLFNAKKEWNDKIGIKYYKEGDYITGKMLKRETLPIISGKYAKMLDTLFNNIKHSKGKTFIFHNYIHMSGILFIEQVLKYNNIIGENDEITNDTLCSICMQKKKHHSVSQLYNIENQNLESIEQNSQPKSQNKKHIFHPLRFGIAHSKIDKISITNTLEKFNNTNNIDGRHMMILLGTKLLKEGHSMNSVRNVMIMSRPDNISSLIQIMGRALRIKAHIRLPPKDRNVNIYLFTSSIGVNSKSLSYEEEKYRQKVESFKVIQEIERIMNNVAIDKFFNYDTIWGKLKGHRGELDILPYDKYDGLSITKPNAAINDNIIPLNKVNFSTFNVYYQKKTVKTLIYIIKRLFIEVSQVWTYDDLLRAVKFPVFAIEINTRDISVELFNIALNNVIYNSSKNYEEINLSNVSYNDEFDDYEDDITNKTKYLNQNLVDKIRDPTDKIIMSYGGVDYVIVHTGELYCLTFIKDGEAFIDIDCVFRTFNYEREITVDISKFLKHEDLFSYDSKKDRFISKWENCSIQQLEKCFCEFGISFHTRFIEEIIEYVFNLLFQCSLQKKYTKNKHHNFYIKMLQFYNIYKFIIWAHVIDKDSARLYSKFIIPVNSNDIMFNIVLNASEFSETVDKHYRLAFQKNPKEKSLEQSTQEINTLNKSIETEYNSVLHKYMNFINKKYEDEHSKKCTGNKTSSKIKANLLPVGHTIGNHAKIFNPENSSWSNYNQVVSNNKENNTIVGYDDRTKTSMTVKFKLRDPYHKSKKSTERGSFCATKTKKELFEIAKKLSIATDKNMNVPILCNMIRTKLINLELAEKCKPNGVKYFYTVLEKQPF